MARFFTGTSDKIGATSGLSALPTTGTFAIWIKPHNNSNDNNDRFYFCFAYSNWAKQFGVWKGGDNKLYIGCYNNPTDYRHIKTDGNYTFTANVWHLIIHDWTNGGTTHAYLDGTDLGAANSSPLSLWTDVPTQLNFGQGENGTSSKDANADIGNFCMWNTVLDSTQRAALLNGAKPSDVASGNVVMYYPIRGSNPEPTTAGSGPTLTPTDSPSFTVGKVDTVGAYTYFRGITVDHTKCGTADTTDFQFLLNGTFAWAKTEANGGNLKNASGYDLFFTSSNAGNTPLDFEIEKWDGTTGELIAWVRIPTLTYNSNLFIYVWYGNAETTISLNNKYAMWTNHKNVSHMNSASNAYEYSSTSGSGSDRWGDGDQIASGTGKIGLCKDFDGSKHMRTGATNLMLPNNYTDYMTFSLWFKLGAVTWANAYCLFSQFYPEMVAHYYQDEIRISYNHNSPSFKVTGFTHDTNWHHLVVTAKMNDIDQTHVYLDGVEKTLTWSATPHTAFASTENAWANEIGCDNRDHWGKFLGSIDEVRLATIAYSQSRITAEYNNQNDPSSFYTISDGNVDPALAGGCAPLVNGPILKSLVGGSLA